MKKMVVFSCFILSLFASDDYTSVSELSDNKKKEYNFVNKDNSSKPLGTDIYKSVSQENYETIKPLKKVEIEEISVNNIEYLEKKEEIVQNIETVDKTFVKEYKDENILKDEVKYSDNSFSKDFSVTPKLSYMHVTTSVDKLNINNKSHEIVPEISLTYKNSHTIKADYFNVNAEEFDTNWYKVAYLYKFLNANIGLGYNGLTLKNHIENKENDAKFPTIEVHLINSQNQLQVEYGGSYGKNSDDIKSAYEYYLSLGYKIFNNDNLIINAGYKNRTIKIDESDKIEYKGPTVGISSTF